MHRTLPIIALALALAGTAPAAGAAPAGAAQGAVVLTDARIARALSAHRAGGRTAHAIAPADAFRYWAVVRTRPGSVELHRDWVDVTTIRSGTGLLRTGTRVGGDVETARGEWRGGRILDPRVREIGAGDILVIPAGTPHQFIPTGTAPLTYVTVKVPAAAPGRGR